MSMNYFRYKMMKASGEVVSGVVNLPYEDILSAISYLESGENTTIFVKKMGTFSSFIFKLIKQGIRKKIERKFLAEWFNNLSMMLKAGMPLATALEESAVSSDRPDFESDVSDIILSIQRGSSFSAAVERQSHLFPKTAMYLIRIGEESGTLDDRLKDAADHLTRIHAIISDTKQALLYPFFVVITMGGGMIFWFYYVVPKIVSLFKDMDVTLPPLTIFIIGISNFIQAYFFHIIIFIAVFVFAITTLYKNVKPFKKVVDTVLLKTPIAGTLIQASSLAFITEYFSLLLNAGIDIIQSVKILEESIGSEVYRGRLREIKENLSSGTTISDSFTKAKVFPRFICRMINIGEMSGTLPDQLNYIAQDYKQKLTSLVANLGKIIEPVVLVVSGIMFAIIMAGLFLPIYDLVGNLSTM
ncbi:MAG: type II secretion system F family protein [Proteobacteria bacterium]|nr:type II secretion system F family protein [Pseudomonadota bacterium]MBU2630719.1 type II secretion system F family protein [Pseudomonadota bacterium]